MVTGRRDRILDALTDLAVRLIGLAADHLPSLALFGLSILLHRLAPYVKHDTNPVFQGFVDATVYLFFILGVVRLFKWTILDLASPRRHH